jgi:iron complex transport system permease protein
MIQSIPTYTNVNAIRLSALSGLLFFVCVASLCLGAYAIPLGNTLSILFNAIGISSANFELSQSNVLLQIRLPRILLNLIIGGGLGIAGAALQGMFRNPLVEPGLIGVSSGSALFAIIFIVFVSGGTTSTFLTSLGLPLFAFVGGLLHVGAVFKLSSSHGNSDTATLILAGIAINAFAGALIGLVLFFADDSALRSFTFWSLGDMSGASWDKIPYALFLIGIPSIIILQKAQELNALALGEQEAYHMGVPVRQVKILLLIVSALIVGAGVSMVGIIGFVGLVVPHLVRLLFSADHRIVLPGSFLFGAILVNAADLIARLIVIPAEMPIGVITALCGAPFFIWLIFNFKKTRS